MDGVTDAAFRYLVAKTSQPDVIITEFTNVEGLARGAVKMLLAFRYSEVERPVVAQIYGTEVESYYKVALMLCHLGFDGIDINMGCPANKVARRGSGAGLIRTPELAKELVRTTKQAVEDWSNGKTLEAADIRPKIITALRKIRPQEGARKKIPVSVKTRIGYDSEIAEEWTKHLLEAEPANISLHGRTLKQMYSGQADWEAIGRAARLCKGTGISLLGNGDISSLDDAFERIKAYGVNGVLVGRATYGSPWFFSGKEPTVTERIAAGIEHSELYEQILPELNFHNMRKHLAWYCKGFSGAKEVRSQLMRAESAQHVRQIFAQMAENS